MGLFHLRVELSVFSKTHLELLKPRTLPGRKTRTAAEVRHHFSVGSSTLELNAFATANPLFFTNLLKR